MDATLFDIELKQIRSSCYPEPTDQFQWGYATLLAHSQVRAAGLYGSSNFACHFVSVGQGKGLGATVAVELPPGYFGTVRPPMIYAVPQFGRKIFYKIMRDASEVFTSNITSYWDTPPGAFHVSIANLRPEATVIGGETKNSWKFLITLFCYYTTHRYGKPGYYGMKWQEVPEFDGWKWDTLGITGPYETVAGQVAGEDKLSGIMHWYAIGVDAW